MGIPEMQSFKGDPILWPHPRRVGVIKIVIVINCNLITFSKVIACNCN